MVKARAQAWKALCSLSPALCLIWALTSTGRRAAPPCAPLSFPRGCRRTGRLDRLLGSPGTGGLRTAARPRPPCGRCSLSGQGGPLRGQLRLTNGPLDRRCGRAFPAPRQPGSLAREQVAKQRPCGWGAWPEAAWLPVWAGCGPLAMVQPSPRARAPVHTPAGLAHLHLPLLRGASLCHC